MIDPDLGMPVNPQMSPGARIRLAMSFLVACKIAPTEQARMFGFTAEAGRTQASLEHHLLNRIDETVDASVLRRAEILYDIREDLSCALGDAHDEKRRWLEMRRDSLKGRSFKDLMMGTVDELKEVDARLETIIYQPQ